MGPFQQETYQFRKRNPGMIVWTWRWKDDDGIRYTERYYDDGSKYVTEYHPDFVRDYRITKDGKKLAEVHMPKFDDLAD